jgi:hypothetical protein
LKRCYEEIVNNLQYKNEIMRLQNSQFFHNNEFFTNKKSFKVYSSQNFFFYGSPNLFNDNCMSFENKPGTIMYIPLYISTSFSLQVPLQNFNLQKIKRHKNKRENFEKYLYIVTINSDSKHWLYINDASSVNSECEVLIKEKSYYVVKNVYIQQLNNDKVVKVVEVQLCDNLKEAINYGQIIRKRFQQQNNIILKLSDEQFKDENYEFDKLFNYDNNTIDIIGMTEERLIEEWFFAFDNSNKDFNQESSVMSGGNNNKFYRLRITPSLIANQTILDPSLAKKYNIGKMSRDYTYGELADMFDQGCNFKYQNLLYNLETKIIRFKYPLLKLDDIFHQDLIQLYAQLKERLKVISKEPIKEPIKGTIIEPSKQPSKQPSKEPSKEPQRVRRPTTVQTKAQTGGYYQKIYEINKQKYMHL